MTKRDKFVAYYCGIWIMLIVISGLLNEHFKLVERDTYVLICNMLFLNITASFVLIKPIGNLVDNYIINKL